MLPSDGRYWELDSFFRRDLIFGGRLYRFLGGKSKESKSTGEAGSTDRLFTAWFFAERSLYGHSFDLEEIKVEQVWQWLGDLRSISTYTKLNARLSLGFSITLPCCAVDSDRIIVFDDVWSPNGAIMTDGCGFIHASLVDSVFYGISAGVPSSEGEIDFSRRRLNLPLPTILQVRIRCPKGLFKGCLLVTHDADICPFDSVVLRKSMLKVSVSNYEQRSMCSIDVCNTFEHPQLLRNSEENLDFHSCCSATLNRFVCLLLHHLGVPEQMFTDLMAIELEKILQVHLDRRAGRTINRSLIRMTETHPHNVSLSCRQEEPEERICGGRV